MKNAILFIAAGIFIHFSGKSQTLVNGGLEGPESSIDPPPGWEMVPYTDINCEANDWAGATPDVTTATGPVASNGLNGNPHQGISFISGLYVGDPGNISHHEGIQQTISGFSINVEYTISFWQTVIKQMMSDCLDTTGSWGVYLDNDLLAVVPMSHSLLPPASLNHLWDYREVTFLASATTHTIKFLPADDDNNQSIAGGQTGALRMGIDDVKLFRSEEAGLGELTEQELSISPSPTSGAFEVSLKNSSSIRSVKITNSLGVIISEIRLESSAGVVQTEIQEAAGIYFVTVTCEDGKIHTVRIEKL